MNKYILDSSALLAVINQEAGMEQAAKFCQPICLTSYISSVNLCETIGKMALRGVPIQSAAKAISDLVSDIIPFDQSMALLAAKILPETKALGLSLGDRACLATAQHLGLDVITADKAWAKLKTTVKIKLIR